MTTILIILALINIVLFAFLYIHTSSLRIEVKKVITYANKVNSRITLLDAKVKALEPDPVFFEKKPNPPQDEKPDAQS
jgi:hypothetical protein